MPIVNHTSPYDIRFHVKVNKGEPTTRTPIITITGQQLDTLIPAESLIFKSNANIKICINMKNHKLMLSPDADLSDAWVQCMLCTHEAVKKNLQVEQHSCLQLAALIMKKIRQKRRFHACAHIDTSIPAPDDSPTFFINSPRKSNKRFILFNEAVSKIVNNIAQVYMIPGRSILVLQPIHSCEIHSFAQDVIREIARFASRHAQHKVDITPAEQLKFEEDISFWQELLDALTLRNKAFCP